MNINNDIARYAIPHNCGQCTMNGCCNFVCHNTPNPKCNSFVPNNMDDFLNYVITYSSVNIPMSKDKKLKRVCTYGHASNDRTTTLDMYYTAFINDCVSELRKGRMVYIFRLSHLWDVLRFINNVKAIYQGDGIIGLINTK